MPSLDRHSFPADHQRSLTAHSIANTVRMSRIQHKGAFLVLEGDTDARLFKRFTDSAWCRIMPAFGKDRALKVLEILNKEKFPGVLVVVDAWHEASASAEG